MILRDGQRRAHDLGPCRPAAIASPLAPRRHTRGEAPADPAWAIGEPRNALDEGRRLHYTEREVRA